jgi:hypothetical protein
MNKFVFPLTAILCVVLAGCTPVPVKKDWAATSGSRADATVRLSFEYDPGREVPELDEKQALIVAKKRCNSWGYENAEAFDAVVFTRNCILFGDGWSRSPRDCVSMMVTREFQCLGRGDAGVSSK